MRSLKGVKMTTHLRSASDTAGRLAVAMFVWFTSAAVAIAAAPPRESPGPDAKGLLRSAYAKTKDAKTLQDYTQILQWCEQARQGDLSPELAAYAKELTAWAYNRRGETLAEQAVLLNNAGKRAEGTRADAGALADFEKAIELNPKYWKALHNRGVSYAVAGKADAALADFSRAIELKPNYPNTWFNRGGIYYEQGKFTEAAADYGEAVRLKPDDREAIVHRGHAYFRLKRYSAALADYTRAVELAPDNAELLANRGDAHASLGQWSEAAADFRRAVTLDAASAHSLQSAAWLMATCPDARYRNAELALQTAEKAVQVGGRKEFQYLDTLAAAHANAGQFEKAQEAVAEALKVAPPSQRQALEGRQELYQKKQPYRQRLVTPSTGT
jgi:tetratricopeptide (TPR) repeat protein